MSFSAEDPTFQGLLASLRQAQDGQPPPVAKASPSHAHQTSQGTESSSGASGGGYTVPYVPPPAVDGVYPTYASLGGPPAADLRTRQTDDEYSPLTFQPLASSATASSSSLTQQQRHDPFATTSGAGQKGKDLRLLGFTACLPYLTRLAEDEKFIALLRQLKTDQDALEQQLSEERKAIVKQHRDAVEKAEFRASMSGQKSLTAFQKKDLTDGLAATLSIFHLRRVLPAWDALVDSQVARLESRGVPGLGTSKQERESEAGKRRLEKVLTMLEGVLEDS